MKKLVVISTLVATALLNTNPAQAEASKEENVGFASGAVVGAAVGGPIGFIVGSVAGVLVGDQVNKANELDTVKQELVESNAKSKQLQQEIAMIQENIEFEQNSGISAEWMTEGLTMNVMFTTNSSNLSDADVAAISRLSRVLKEFPELNIRLDGYSDPRGSKADNLILSQKRAESVKQAFKRFGISPARVAINAHGEMTIPATNVDLDAYAMARKVSVNFSTQPTDRVAQN